MVTIHKSQQKRERGNLGRVVDLLGGHATLKRDVTNPLDAHEVLMSGLPANAAVVFLNKLVKLQKGQSFEKAVGMSWRTVQRYKKWPRRNLTLNLEQSGSLWKFAEILAKATQVFGSQEEAEQWLERPAMALEQRRPIDLLATPAGAELVEQLLGRLEYGVYV